jgi:hypothetical protein
MKVAVLCSALAGMAVAQVPTGTIAGVVGDPAGASVSGARVLAVNFATKLTRSELTSDQGLFSFSALAPGEYLVSVLANGFAPLNRPVWVVAGTTTIADCSLPLSDLKESVNVEPASAQMRYDSHMVGGVITGGEIQNLPLNGRSFLELAKLEAGVQPPRPTSGNRTVIPLLGAPGGVSGRGTRVTVDGVSKDDWVHDLPRLRNKTWRRHSN